MEEARRKRPRIIRETQRHRVNEGEAGAGRGGEWAVSASGHGASFWGEENILDLVVMVVKLCENAKATELTVHFARVSFTCELCLN